MCNFYRLPPPITSPPHPILDIFDHPSTFHSPPRYTNAYAETEKEVGFPVCIPGELVSVPLSAFVAHKKNRRRAVVKPHAAREF
jgi:hypothetical protein